MPIQASDIRQRASNVMADVPEGGGGPSGNFIIDGTSNMIFPDVTEAARAGGQVSIRQLFLSVVTPDTEEFMDANIIVAQPPNDANVSITLAKCAMFHRRTDIANAIENYLIQGPEWGGFLLENHVEGQRSVQIFQRPGAPTPNIGRTLVLIYAEGTPDERRQYVRVSRAESDSRTFTYDTGGGFVDYVAAVVTCEISDALRVPFPGSPPDRGFVRDELKTVIRDTTVADATSYYGASPLAMVAALGDQSVRVGSVYSQLVPSARTETVALDQRPAAQRTLTLATSPREVNVGAAPHSTRIKVGQENRGFSWVNILKPFPAPNTVVISYMALGVWYTVTDDGAGVLSGAGSGTVNYTNGSISVTTPALPDVGSAIIFNWGENSAYTDRSGQAGYRAPEFAWALPQAPLKPGSVVVTWLSGGTLRTATDNGSGAFTGAHATGEINYAAGKIFLRPNAMIDAGGEFKVDYRYSTTKTESFTGVTVDAGGFATVTLAEAPAPRSVSIDWITVRNVSASTGVSDFVSNSSAASSPVYETRTVTTFTPILPPMPAPPPPPAPFDTRGLIDTSPGTTVYPAGVKTFKALLNVVDLPGSYTWAIERVSGAALTDAFEALTGSFTVTDYQGVFSIKVKATLPESCDFKVSFSTTGGTLMATTASTMTAALGADAGTTAYLKYAYSSLNGFSGQEMGPLMQLTTLPDTSTALYFTGPVPNGAYNWAILADNGAASFVSIAGSFEVRDGSGGFWVVTVPAAPLTKFVVEVRKTDGTTLVRTQQVQVLAAAPTSGWQPPPPTSIKVRDPVTTGQALTGNGASPIAGMYAGGVDTAGKTVFVAVPPTNSAQWGSTYNPPKTWDTVWSAADIAAKTKSLASDAGITIDYRIWGA